MFTFSTFGSGAETFNRKKLGGFYISCIHVQGDPEKVFRIHVESPCGLNLEITPSKGLSMRNCSYEGRQMFWDPPMENLPDPETVDLFSTVICDGVPVENMGWLRYFSSHVEMLGLHNWGMPETGEYNKPLPLHGNVSNIPVKEVTAELLDDRLRLTGSFNVYGAGSIFPKKGNLPDFRVTKQINLFSGKPVVFQKDTITNVTKSAVTPDWGYHVQLRPEPECRYLLPAGSVEERFGGNVPDNHNEWKPAAVPSTREERGYIYKNLFVEKAFSDGTEGVQTLLKYKNSPGTEVIIPPSPYTMGWYSCGGGGGDNFIIPADLPGEKPLKLLTKNWDGIGPEIGSSDPDHNGNTDTAISATSLAPGESMSIRLEFRFLDNKMTHILENKIVEYQQGFNKSSKLQG